MTVKIINENIWGNDQTNAHIVLDLLWIFFFFFYVLKSSKFSPLLKNINQPFCEGSFNYIPVHSTSWKFGLYFVCIFIANWNFLTKFWSSDPSFSRNILTSLYVKSETSAHAQLRNCLFIHTIHKFHDKVSVGNLH